MKTFLSRLLFLIFLSVIFWGCDDRTQNDSSYWVLSAEPEFVSSWPENEWTSQIPEPQKGTVDYVCDDTDNGRYQVVLKEISKEECQDYIRKLLEQGYQKIASESNKVSTGTILQKEETLLSIAYSEDVLNILIIMDDGDKS